MNFENLVKTMLTTWSLCENEWKIFSLDSLNVLNTFFIVFLDLMKTEICYKQPKPTLLYSCMTVKMHNLLKHKTALSCQFVVFQWKPHFIHDFSSITAALKLFILLLKLVILNCLSTLKLFISLLLRFVSILRCNIQTACSSMFSQCENIVLTRCVSLKNTSYSFIAHFEGNPQETRTSNRLAFSRCFWNLLFIQQQHAQIALTLFWLHTSLFHQNVLLCSLPIRCIGW